MILASPIGRVYGFVVEPLPQRSGVLAVYAGGVVEFRGVNLRRRGVARKEKF
jgi:hypothetical protein